MGMNEAEQLQELAARGWPALEREALGAWTLRASRGFTRRANSVLVVGEPGMSFDDACSRIARFYGARGLPAYVQIAPETAFDAHLAARGWASEAPVSFRIASLDAMRGALKQESFERDVQKTGREEPAGAIVALSSAPDEAWLALYHRASTAGLAAALDVLTGVPSVFATVREPSGEALAIGRAVVLDGWVGFAAVETRPAHRRRGLATAVMRALVDRAAEDGATRAFLQVERDNRAALALYARMGFVEHHRYHYRRAPRVG